MLILHQFFKKVIWPTKATIHLPELTELTELTSPVSIPDKERKLTLNFYFRASLWCLKWFYEGGKGFIKHLIS